jgi:putative aldouronate transport system substrate-binding protein
LFKKSLAKWLSLFMALAIVLTACGQGSGGNATEGQDNGGQAATSGDGGQNGGQASGDTGEKTVLSAFSSQGARIISFNDNLVTQKIEEKLGIDIEFETAPSDGARDKQNLLLASGDYPAAFFGGDFTKVDQLKYGKLGIFVPLNELIDKYAPNIQKAFEENPGYKAGVTAPDGNIYALPGFDGCFHCFYPAKQWINEEWLKKLNLQLPTTTEEYENVLKAFKEQDPNGNGKKDEVPVSGYTSTGSEWGNPMTFLMNSFVYTDPSNYLQVSGGNIDLVADNQEWKDGLTYINKLYSQGLIDQQSFTQNQSSLQQIAMNPGDIILGIYPDLWNGDIMTIYGESEDQRWNQYVAVPPLKGPNGIQYTTYNGDKVQNAKFAITDKASEAQQIAAIQVADYLFTQEGALDGFLGVDGWVLVDDENMRGTNGEKAIFNTTPGSDDWEAPTNGIWENGFYYMSVDLFHGQEVSQDVEVQEGNEVRLYNENTKYVGKEPPADVKLPDIFIDPDSAQTVAELSTVINSYVRQNAVAFAIGQKNLDKDWDAYVQGLKDMGAEKYLQIYQQAYDASK